MFTGIVQGMAEIRSFIMDQGIARLTVDLGQVRTEQLIPGASVAVNGVCLTVVRCVDGLVWFDVIDETLRMTNLGSLQPGHWVNIERAARFGDEIGGHVLSGHVHGLAEVVDVHHAEGNMRVRWRVPERCAKYVFPKGYVALNGCSLTVGTVEDGLCAVHLIPETRRLTTFGTLSVGAQLNLEVDSQTQAIVDTVERVLASR